MTTNKRSLRNWNIQALVHDLSTAWRLLWDPKVPSGLKLVLPVLAFLYMVSPIDLLPLNPIDDIAVLVLALRLFVQFATNNQPDPEPTPRSNWQSSPMDDENTIETTWRVIDNKR
jgi:uncharacterized membrane protein YkvA (DUF1232 family)